MLQEAVRIGWLGSGGFNCEPKEALPGTFPMIRQGSVPTKISYAVAHGRRFGLVQELAVLIKEIIILASKVTLLIIILHYISYTQY
jgi:hypothetical protein